MADHYVVERSTTINAAPEVVFEKVVDLTQWDDWSPWAEMDPDMDTTHGGTAGEVGSTYQWKGNRKVGEGSMRVTEVQSPERVALDLHFLKPFNSESEVEWLVDVSGDGASVTWRMTAPHSRMTKFIGMFRSMDKMVGPDFEKGLAKLKRVVEA